MKEKIIRLKALREHREVLNTMKKAAYDKYIIDNKDLFSEIDILEDALTQTETEIRDMALVEYSETGEKKLKYGVGIRIMQKLEYEESNAFQWAVNHALCLSLDKKAFEKVAKANPMDFVKINEIPQATLPFVINLDGEQK